MNFLRKIFTKSDNTKLDKKPAADTFTIEHYPLTNRHYPKYNDEYLLRDLSTGIMNTINALDYADFGDTEKKAKDIIILFKEQRLKENVFTTPVTFGATATNN